MEYSYVIRPAQLADYEQGLGAAKELDGQGMTSWPNVPEVIMERHTSAVATFAGREADPKKQTYLLVAERPDGEIAAWGAVYGSSGYYPSWRVYENGPNKVLYSEATLSNKTELGTMFLKNKFKEAGAKIEGLGKAVSRSRLMLIANQRELFTSNIFAEFRCYRDAGGRARFAEWFAENTLNMTANEMNVEIGRYGHEVVLKSIQMWHDPIDCSTLPEDVQYSIGRPHEGSVPARAILTKEGFENSMISLYDAGPQTVGHVNNIKTIADSKVLRARFGEVSSDEGRTALVSNTSIQNFRAVSSPVKMGNDGTVVLPHAAREALILPLGGHVRVAPEAFELRAA